MSPTEKINRKYLATLNALEEAFSLIDPSLSPGQITREKQKLRGLPEYQLARWKINPVEREEIPIIEDWLGNLVLPLELKEFFQWSKAFFYLGVEEARIMGSHFSASELELAFRSQSQLHSHNLEIFWNQRKPLEFRRVFPIGEYARADLGVWLSPDHEHGMEVIMFEQRHKQGFVVKDKFKVVASSFKSFLERIAYCVETDICLNLLSPSEKEVEWLRRNEIGQYHEEIIAQEFPYTFKFPLTLPEKWQIRDLASETSYVLDPVIKRFGGKRDPESEKRTLVGYRRRFKFPAGFR